MFLRKDEGEVMPSYTASSTGEKNRVKSMPLEYVVKITEIKKERNVFLPVLFCNLIFSWQAEESYPPKSSKRIFSLGMPIESSIFITAAFMSGGPHR